MNRRILVSLIATIAIEILFYPLESQMKDHGYGIVEQELSWSYEKTVMIVQAWEPVKTVVIIFMALDMLFPLAYGSLIYFLHDEYDADPFKNIGKRLIVIAVVCDYLENLLTFVVLFTDFPRFVPIFVSFFATVKFTFILASLVMFAGLFINRNKE